MKEDKEKSVQEQEGSEGEEDSQKAKGEEGDESAEESRSYVSRGPRKKAQLKRSMRGE